MNRCDEYSSWALSIFSFAAPRALRYPWPSTVAGGDPMRKTIVAAHAAWTILQAEGAVQIGDMRPPVPAWSDAK
jgi:hypothetical protein